MTLVVQPVTVQYAAQVWPLVEEHIEEALKYANGDYTIDQLKAFVCTGQQTLIVAVDSDNKIQGAATIFFDNGPNDRVAFITAVGGKMITGKDTFLQLRAVLGLQGATKIQGAVRPSMARLSKKYGFNEVAVLMEIKL